MSHSWTWKALERVLHFCKIFATHLEENREEEEPIVSMMQLARTTLAEKRIIDIFALHDQDRQAQRGAIVED